MKESHFDGIVRNGITRHFKKSPESVLSQYMTGKVSGIGVLPLALLIPPLIKLIQKLAKVFKKNAGDAGDVGGDDAPSPADFGNMASDAKQEIQNEMRYNSSASATSDGASSSGGNSSGGDGGSGDSRRSSDDGASASDGDNGDLGSGAGGGRKTNLS